MDVYYFEKIWMKSRFNWDKVFFFQLYPNFILSWYVLMDKIRIISGKSQNKRTWTGLKPKAIIIVAKLNRKPFNIS